MTRGTPGIRSGMSEVAAVVDNWAGRNVLVVGDAMLDEWRFADTDRLCREAPAPVLTLRHRRASAGGAANTAVNVAALGGRATLVAPVGADTAGGEIRACLDRAGVRDHTLLRPDHPTPVKRRLLAADQILVREDEGGPAGPLPDDAVRLLLDALAGAADEVTGPGAALVICDYGLGALPGPVRAWLLAHRHSFDTVALDAHDLDAWRGLAPTVVTPSLGEAHAALRPGSGPPPAVRRGHRAGRRTGWRSPSRTCRNYGGGPGPRSSRSLSTSTEPWSATASGARTAATPTRCRRATRSAPGTPIWPRSRWP
ncbi:hypothetical protein Prubr_20520 [Polymorphospora rubra]|uniref:Carbohydrate kinase PfkB domain-containing protein n=1 Tax=Polymorphospora rubra TaxID=338584 RepID=A0A810MV60_9ACTN|nr:hypothetical protein Prubr_20520 [Polymorphospora rubra]